jgi:hypothetical protein
MFEAAASSTAVSGWAVVGYIVGVLGLGITVLREWRERLERRRIRPVVIVHEQQRRSLHNRRWLARVYLTNESSASAFNVRFGIQIGDSEVPWKHAPDAADASRLNVLAPATRYPEGTATIELIVPDEIVFSTRGDPDADRRYRARYTSPAGESWYTCNPTARSEDLIVKRVRLRWWSDWRNGRAMKRASEAGAGRITAVNEELRSQLLDQLRKQDDTEGNK